MKLRHTNFCWYFPPRPLPALCVVLDERDHSPTNDPIPLNVCILCLCSHWFRAPAVKTRWNFTAGFDVAPIIRMIARCCNGATHTPCAVISECGHPKCHFTSNMGARTLFAKCISLVKAHQFRIANLLAKYVLSFDHEQMGLVNTSECGKCVSLV